ncbi:MAG: hypothetical protein ACD_77C00343G0002 [uncultured bacterium]|nr:MAG: hypothetical protein ACD_77C00343G0002 [uncultured bacterium]
MFDMAPDLEKRAQILIKEGKTNEAKELLTKHTNDFAAATMQKWLDLKADLWSIFARAM